MSEFGVYLLMGAGIFLLLGLIVFFSWLTSLQEQHGSLPRAGMHAIRSMTTVNRSAIVMSRSDDNSSPIAASSLGTDAGRTPDGRTPARPKAEQYFTLCQLMRTYGIKRDEALAAFKACDIPFSSDLWRDAAPPEPEQRTPIAGRPTDADFPFEPIT